MHRHIRCTWRGRENYFEFVLPSVTVQWVTSLHYYHLISDYPSLIFGGFAFQSSTWFLNYSQCISPRVIIQFPGHFGKLSLSHWKSFKLIVTCRLHLAPSTVTDLLLLHPWHVNYNFLHEFPDHLWMTCSIAWRCWNCISAQVHQLAADFFGNKNNKNWRILICWAINRDFHNL